MKKKSLWEFAATLICGMLAVATGCKSGKQVKETDDTGESSEITKIQERMYALYGENKKITDGNYDKSLAVKCINGTFVGRKNDNVIAYKGIPFVGKQPVGELRWKAPVDIVPDDGVYEAYYNAKSPCQGVDLWQIASLYVKGEDCLHLNVWKAASEQEQSQASLNSAEREQARLKGKDWVRVTFNNINIVRTWQELNGEDAVPNEQLAKKKSICTSRRFNGMIADKDTLRTHIANYASRCAEKLRRQDTVASVVGVFVSSNPFREDLLQYWKYDETRLITPTNSTTSIVKAAADVLDQIFVQGVNYKRAGVIVMGIAPSSPLQQDLFDINAEQIQKMNRLDKVIDRINRCYGSETIVIGAQQYTQKNGKGKANVFANAIKHDFKSKNPTTRWSDIIPLK